VRLVAHALQVGGDLGKGHQHAQVARRGLAAADDGGQLVVDLHLHGIHALFQRGDLLHGLQVELGQGKDGLADLALADPAQLHHPGGNTIEFAVELGRQVLVWHVCLLWDQPNRPVM
jgi:hypothetical protein